MRVEGIRVQRSIFGSHFGGGHGQLEEAVRAAGLLVIVEEGRGVKIHDFAGDFAVVLLRIHRLDATDAALAGDEILPEVVLIVAEGGDDSDPGDDDATFAHECVL